MAHDATLIVDTSGGIERRLAFGVGVAGADAILALEDGKSLQLSDGDLRFLKRALAAIELPPPYPSFIPAFELDEPADSAPPKPHAPSLPRQAGKPWTEAEHEALSRLYREGASPEAISQKLHRTETAIIGRLIAQGLATLQPNPQLRETTE